MFGGFDVGESNAAWWVVAFVLGGVLLWVF